MEEKVINIKPYMQNREFSWLRFNERVLEEAEDATVPLMERLKFISIFTSNLDEFFMVRVGSLFDLKKLGDEYIDSRSGLNADEQIKKIYKLVSPLYKKRNKIYQEVKNSLKAHGVHSLDFAELTKSELKFIKEYFKQDVRPLLSPQIVDTHHPFPHIASKELHIFALLSNSKGSGILGILPIPPTMPKVIFLPGKEIRYIRAEKILYEYAKDAFGSYHIEEKNCICITRNADINPDPESFDNAEDIRELMRILLEIRQKLAVVRLEANYEVSGKLCAKLCEKFEITPEQIFVTNNALDMGYVYSLLGKLSPSQEKQLTYTKFKPVPAVTLDSQSSIIKQIKKKDRLLYYPYESMDTFLRLIKEASTDPKVLSIKITIYRLANKARLVDYLCAAAEDRKKKITVVMELRARFDEQNNIDWSEKLEDAGCKVIYGSDTFKVHSKLCLITMKENTGVSYITQVGTGNFNEKTAELYTDFALFTADKRIGEDALEFFNNIQIDEISSDYKHLLVAPDQLKQPLLRLIDREIAKGKDGRVFIKMNSLTDRSFIEKFAEASKAGVKVDLVIRGICCILPQIEGETDNIRVMSVVGRFLEHTRVFSFGTGEDQVLYLSSADLMTRNTEKRIEVACPVYDVDIKNRINDIMETITKDNVKSRVLKKNGQYAKIMDKNAPIDSQDYFINEYIELDKYKGNKKKGIFDKFFDIWGKWK